MPIDPIQLSKEIRESYIRYLTSSFLLRDTELRQLFIKEANQFLFTKGPLLEATPPFKSGCCIENLINEGVLSNTFAKFIYDALPYLKNNPLHLHQEKAIRRVVAGRNIVIASGTGSGKTESFLLPIYNHILREYENKNNGSIEPGVRAIFLYPMNALANDQIRRLRAIAKIMEQRLENIKITFGRYVGDTPESREQGIQQFQLMNPNLQPVNSELLSREEMRNNPPHILITNYAMLEYLLLRPKDSPFFDGNYAKKWKFLVLDEAHIYNGAHGIEMAMLIRRLKDRVCTNMEGDLQCIATSATLISDNNDFDKVVKFATNLFGEQFEQDDVIVGERIETVNYDNSPTFPLELYSELNNLIKSDNITLEDCRRIFERYNVAGDLLSEIIDRSDGNIKQLLYMLLSKDNNIIKLKSILEKGSKELEYCVRSLTGLESPNENDKTHIINLINVAVWARPDNESQPLLPARYHFFVRAPEGAFVSFYPKPKIFLERRELTEDGYPVFELASCRRCGQEYLVGNIKDNRLVHRIPQIEQDGIIKFFLLKKDSTKFEEDEDQRIAFETDVSQGEVWNLCTKCGKVWQAQPICNCSIDNNTIRTIIEIRSDDSRSTLNKCYLCGLNSIDIIREFVFQQDAPTAVLATSLFQNLQQNKKILAFSDSRQDAAFFAPYLEFTHQRILFRRLIRMALENQEDLRDYRLNSLCNDVVNIANENNVFNNDMGNQERKREVWKWILQEFCGAWDRRNSLEGVGLVSFIPVLPSNWHPVNSLTSVPWNLTEEEAIAVYQIILNTMRYNMAITFPRGGPSPEDKFFYPRNREYKFRGEGSDNNNSIYSFIPAQGRLNSRLDYLKKLYIKITGDKNNAENVCRNMLANIWNDLTTNWIGNGIDTFNEQTVGVLYRLNYEYWKVITENNNNRWFICDKCGVIVPVSVRGICPTFNCNGELQKINNNEIDRNHYRYLYNNIKPKVMRAREHTAQLTTNYAADIQQRFISGEINLLSCSTTFELGVDLGELETVFLRNVPPEPSNYIQRVGRAGRRLDTVGYAITFAHLRSHDLTYFKEPEKMIDGRIKPPFIELRNEKIISRHLHSVVMSFFFRTNPGYFGTLNSFFQFDPNSPSGTSKLKEYIDKKPADILKSLKRVIPQDLQNFFDIDNWGWVSNLIGNDGTLTIADLKIGEEFKQMKRYYKDREAEWRDANDQQRRNQLNSDMNWANNRMEEIKKRQVIDYLASQSVIPKYGFPVDVVELDILSHHQESKNIRLERDLRIAISEFAPGSQVVANGYIWESAGLRVINGRTWPIYWYAICPKCNCFYIQTGTINGHAPNFSCCHEAIPEQNKFKFVTPIFGFVSSKVFTPKQPGETRPEKEFSTRPYFFSYINPTEEAFDIDNLRIQCRYLSDGELAVICKGKKGVGFYICFECGSAFSGLQQRRHKTPYGEDCRSALRGPIHLGHTFKTDVLSISFEQPDLSNKNDSFWFSLLYALLEGVSQSMGIKRQDLDGCLYPSPNGTMLILFDNVPGGAGHVKQLKDKNNLRDAFKTTLNRVKNCSCGIETSCYGCLRNYQNQFCHAILRRKEVLEFLQTNLS